MPVTKRPAPAAPAAPEVNFGDMALYAGGFLLPEGNYCVFFDVRMHQFTKRDGTPGRAARLGVMMTCYNLADVSAEPALQFLSMGTSADKNFAPDPNTGKSLVPVPGGNGSLPRSTNWYMLLNSLYDCGLPVGVFTNDLTALDGIHVHTKNIPEPEERKTFRSQTGEAAFEEDQKQGSGLVPVVTEILDDGKPWEGTGGLPEAEAPKAAAKAPARPAAAPARPPAGPRPVAAKAQVKAAPEPEAGVDEEEIRTAALNGISSVLEQPANANGCTKLAVRTGTFRSVTSAVSPDMAQAVLETYFGSDADLNVLLGELGYVIAGPKVVPST